HPGSTPERHGPDITELHLVGDLVDTRHVAVGIPLDGGLLPTVGEVDIVEAVVREAHEVIAHAEVLIRLCLLQDIAGVADREVRVALLTLDARTDLTPVAELFAEVETIFV